MNKVFGTLAETLEEKKVDLITEIDALVQGQEIGIEEETETETERGIETEIGTDIGTEKEKEIDEGVHGLDLDLKIAKDNDPEIDQDEEMLPLKYHAQKILEILMLNLIHSKTYQALKRFTL
jgi:hypothetical protein